MNNKFHIDVLNYAQHTNLNEDYVGSASVCEYPDCQKPDRYFDVIDPDEKITSKEEITIIFDYPLENPAKRLFKNKNGFTRLDFYRAIYEGYSEIYDKEFREVKYLMENGNDAKKLKEAWKNRPYQIWGHVISDLFIEEVEEIDEGVFKLHMGS